MPSSLLARALPGLACFLLARAAPASENADPPKGPSFLGLQDTIIIQKAPSFPAAYTGPGSFRPDYAGTHLTTAYFGVAYNSRLQAYVNLESFKGRGISSMTGLGSEANGDAIRAGAVLPRRPYFARAYFRYIHPLGGETRPLAPGWDEMRESEPVESVQFKIGKFSPIDDFDKNRYANSARTQFINWSLMVNTAWDLASDTRAYTNGGVLSVHQPTWALRYGLFAVPTTTNGPKLGESLRRGNGRGDNLELEYSPKAGGPVARVLYYRNLAKMGAWRSAIDAAAPGAVPDIFADERAGRRKYGYALNLEWPLADDGETGVYARAGWNDGRTEMWGFADVDRLLSTGVQIAGVRWGRAEDRIGIGWARAGASEDHLDYLARGGRGLFVGDGANRPGYEYVFEMYYRLQLGKYVQLSPDYQRIVNPGYNRDRGPVNIYGLRLRLAFS